MLFTVFYIFFFFFILRISLTIFCFSTYTKNKNIFVTIKIHVKLILKDNNYFLSEKINFEEFSEIIMYLEKITFKVFSFLFIL